MMNSQIEQYKRQTVESMTPGERVVLLFDTAIKNLKAAVMMLDERDIENFTACIARSRNIFFHLETVLDPDYPISEDLAACYAFFRRQISECAKTRDKSHIEVIIPEAETLRDAFVEAAKIVARGG